MPIADIVMFVEDNRLQCRIFYTNDFLMTSLPLDDVIKLGAFSLDSDSWRHGRICKSLFSVGSYWHGARNSEIVPQGLYYALE